MTLIARGKVKEVYEHEPDVLRFRFTDQISVFDKIIPSMIPRKGESLCRTSEHWFNIIKGMNINSHFIRATSPNEMLVRRVNKVTTLKGLEGDERKGCIIPLEFICRHYLAGSMWKRLEKGKVDKGVLGIEDEPVYGQKIPMPFIEITTKFEEYDRPITVDEAIDGFGMREDELKIIYDYILQIDSVIGEEAGKRGLIHVDGKKEFGIDDAGSIMLIDTFGTADEDRFWEMEEYEKGELINLSKEFVRKYYAETGYYDELLNAREEERTEPDIPPLTPEMIAETSALYGNLYERLTGQKF
ncbi:MAG: phosphoribosylaminoimidazolesuccinocarboxamide synthase [Thermoplasmata archaeon]|nr:phosphoribosylaminoimidazolesuccinocarboxamide synthase [Thermoplasmata archaeon]